MSMQNLTNNTGLTGVLGVSHFSLGGIWVQDLPSILGNAVLDESLGGSLRS
jgi:hypothetical protein